MLRFKSLGSGSSGNATLVEAQSGDQSTRLLVDCGLKLGELEARILQADVSPTMIDALFITHEHGDHIGSALSFVKKYGTRFWMSQGTWLAVTNTSWARHQNLWGTAKDGETIQLGALQIYPFTVPHDAREPLQLRCSDGERNLGILTDLGHVSSHVIQTLQNCDALLLEANHDVTMLEKSAYPRFLKQRISGSWGHLSNDASAELLSKLNHAGLKKVLAAHLSERNNNPELVREKLMQAIAKSNVVIDIADPLKGSDWICV